MYRVMNPFNDHKVGDELPDEVVALWPSETLGNRMAFGDIALVTTRLMEEVSYVIPAPLLAPEKSAETTGSPSGTVEESKDEDDTNKSDKKPLPEKPDTTSMTKKEIAAFAHEHFGVEIHDSNRTTMLETLLALWPSS